MDAIIQNTFWLMDVIAPSLRMDLNDQQYVWLKNSAI